ncbi:AraC-like transcriptional regulator QhpR [Chelatococcus reniformis]|uniref:AraC family transcriptional regulator n=1 Tax=Chelatococcus reniformis TaxID=1494448 RepID=A0A916XNH5_9HYPH|nr:AraC family transcriptional regulator [Chelatococcus reniformis]GGC87403.1 AraC family transcriptional regulator [Chelatococcus reniformis]
MAISLDISSLRSSATITAGSAREFLSGVARRRPASAEISSQAGIRGASLRDPTDTLPLAAFTSMLETAAYELGNSALGLELGKEFRTATLGPVVDAMRTAPTLGCAIEDFNRYFPTIQTNTRSALAVSDGTARLAYSILDPTVRFRAQDASFTLAIQHSMLADLVGPSWQPSGVEFRHAAGGDVGRYREHFACPLAFGRAENALLFPARFLSTPLAAADERLHALFKTTLACAMDAQTSRLDFIGSVEAWLAAALCRSATTDIDVVAGDFAMSIRSFQRKLAEHGVAYADVRNDVRSQIARCMLEETDLPVTAIALRLGYSETSAFSRGFKTQVGETPAAYRKRERPAETLA